MLSPKENSTALTQAFTHKAEASLGTIFILSIMAASSIALGDIFWMHSTVGVKTPGVSSLIGGSYL